MGDPHRATVTAAEVLAVSGGVDDATGQTVVCLTLRPIIGGRWAPINYSLAEDHARSLLDRLGREFETSPSVTSGPPGTTV